MQSEPTPHKALHPRKPPDPNIQNTNSLPKPAMIQRKRRSSSPNGRDIRSENTAKLARNSAIKGTQNITASLIDKLDPRGLLKPTEPNTPTQDNTLLMNQTNQNTDTRISHDMNLDNQIPTIQPINNTTLEDMNTNTNTANYDTWFAFDHAKSLHTGNLRSKAKLQYFPPTNIEDNQSPVIIPIQLCEQANEKHANTLFGYFIGANPSFTTVRDHVKSKWAPCGITDIKRNGKGFYLFKFSTEQGMMNVLQSDHWMIKDVPIFIQRWQPGTCLTKAKHDKVPVWVKMHDIPLEAWSVEGIGRIASRIGIPLDMDTYTEEMCVEGKGRCAYARVLIQIAATKPWEEFMEVQTWDLNTKTGVNHLVHLEYSWVPTRCDKCKIYDHSKSTCPLQVNEKAPTSNTNTTANHPTPLFGANADKEGFTLVTKRKRNINSTRGRSRGVTTRVGPTPKARHRKFGREEAGDDDFTTCTLFATAAGEERAIRTGAVGEENRRAAPSSRLHPLPFGELSRKPPCTAAAGEEKPPSPLHSRLSPPLCWFSWKAASTVDIGQKVTFWVSLRRGSTLVVTHLPFLIPGPGLELELMHFVIEGPLLFNASEPVLDREELIDLDSAEKKQATTTSPPAPCSLPLPERNVPSEPALLGRKTGEQLPPLDCIHFLSVSSRFIAVLPSSKVSHGSSGDLEAGNRRALLLPARRSHHRRSTVVFLLLYAGSVGKQLQPSILGRRGPHKTTSPTHIPKPNPQRANNQQKDDFRFIATKSTSSIEKNKSTIINQESNTQTDASTSDFKVANNNTLVEDIQAETTMEDEKTDEVDLNSNWNWYSNASMCRRGTRIAIGWDPGAWDIFVIHNHSYEQVVHCKILNKHSKHTFYMSFIYAENDYRNRRILWEYLRAHQNLVKDEPWLVSGDFNQILKPGESTRSSSFDSYMDDFQRCIEDTNLIDINATGLYYTWNQKPRGVGGLLRKLDRTMGNTNILSLFPRINVMYKPYGISDHSPAVIEFPIGKPKKSYDFKFVNTIADHPQFLDTVQLHWNSRIDGHSMYQVFKKLKNLKYPIRKISHQMGNPSKKVEALRTEVEKVQQQLDREPDNEELSFEHATYLDEFTTALSEEESLLRQKAKLNWLKDGDRNTKYYHKVIKEKQYRNRINSITDGEGIVHGADKVTEVALEYFSDFLGKSIYMEPISSPNDLFTNTLSADDANWMIRPVNDEEIKQALFDIGNDKAPGPDGYTSTFFKKSWHIVGKDVCLAVKEFFLNGQLLQAINHTILALLPKVENPNTMKDFRPISFDWNFLHQILGGFGFHPRMTQWIMKCISTTSFSISINGETKGYITGQRGLRQGDPMSPYLFTLIMEIFNLMIKRWIKQIPNHKYHWRCMKHKLTHLCFADDLLIFSHGSIRAIQVVKDTLQEFQAVSGLVPNPQKSLIFYGKMTTGMKTQIANIMGFMEEKLPVRYLGIPLVDTRMLIRDCNKLVEQVKARIQNWKHKALSFAGRLQLIKSVLQSLQVYWCSVMLLPKTVIKDIEKIFKGFLWTGGDLKKGKAKVDWKMVCRPTEEGGLGIRDLQTWNEALLTRQIWRLFTVKDSLWVDWVKCHHLLKHSFWEVKKKDLQGVSWTNLLVLRDKIWKHVWIKPGWPGGWDIRFPSIQMQGLPNLQMNGKDQVLWKDITGKVTNFSPTQVWSDIRKRNPTVLWYKIVWFKSQIPSHAFILWLALHNRLMTHDRMITWSTNANLQCTLCNTNPDSIVHLFFECNYSREVWNKVCLLCNIHITENNFHQVVELIRSSPTSNNPHTDIKKLTLAASVYYIWRERNTRYHNGAKIPHDKLAVEIYNTIRIRLCGMKMKWNKTMEEICRHWKIPRPRSWPQVQNNDYEDQ
ncbi:hypothetical protein LXL04_001865 [Taraxacum kok-saghyz]